MILSKLVIKTLILYFHFKPFIFVKNNGFIGVMVLTLVMTSLLQRLLNVSLIRYFSVLILLCQHDTHNKTICEGKHV